MSDAVPAPKEWPPLDLIAGLSLETTAEPESELDEKVQSGKSFPKIANHALLHCSSPTGVKSLLPGCPF